MQQSRNNLQGMTAAPATDAKRIQPRSRKDSTPMNHWELLEIEPTGDSRIIKKAYAAKLKECHPEDNPEGFMQLQEAYKRALRQAEQLVMASRRQAHIQNEPVQESRQSIPQAPLLDLSSWHSSRAPERQEEAPVTPAEQFMALLGALCANDGQRQDPAAWQKLLHKDDPWPPEIVPLLQERVMALLKANTSLPWEAWYSCNDLFGWTESENLDSLFTSEELIELFGNRGNAKISMRIIAALCHQGDNHVACGHVLAAIQCYKKILDWFSNSDIPEVWQNAVYTAEGPLLHLERRNDSRAVYQARKELVRLRPAAGRRRNWR